MTYHIAVDIGASSGRLILADFEKNKWKLSELHRFKNGFHFSQGHDRWDVEELFRQIIVGLEKAKQRGIEKCTCMAICIYQRYDRYRPIDSYTDSYCR